MRIQYLEKRFRAETMTKIEKANEIIEEYLRQGFRLTLRQLYYQFVARDLIANTVQSYSNLGSIVNDARLAGLIDWDAIEDRTRNLKSVSHWSDPSEIMQSAAASFRVDKWCDQKYRPEVWVEKEALAGVIEPVCRRLDVSFLACRGYMSQSEMWAAAQRMAGRYRASKQIPVVIHLGDHDPSGIDMTRDITDRLEMFGIKTEGGVNRIALNFDQIAEFNPPPNPAKTTDSRFQAYVQAYGTESWELDALDPRSLDELITKTVLEYRNESLWEAQVEREAHYRAKLAELAEDYDWSEEGGE